MPAVAETAWKVRRHFVLEREHHAFSRLVGQRVTPEELAALVEEAAGSLAAASPSWTNDALNFLEIARGDVAAYVRERVTSSARARTILLYGAIRILRPTHVIETGCFTGWDSLLILAALERNGSGALHTIDLPARIGSFSQFGSKQGLPEGWEPGFLVPPGRRDRWELRLANVLNDLPVLLGRLGGVDLFFHDSDHSYEHMRWELETAWPTLQAGGIAVSDDIAWSTAFRDFARSVQARPVLVPGQPNFGALRKEVR